MAQNPKMKAGLKRYHALKRKMAKAGLSTAGKKDALQRRWNAHEKSHGRKGGPKPKAAAKRKPAKRKPAKRKPRKRTTKTQTTTTTTTTKRGGRTTKKTTTTKKNWLDGWGW